jgi:hypothetical protein
MKRLAFLVLVLSLLVVPALADTLIIYPDLDTEVKNAVHNSTYPALSRGAGTSVESPTGAYNPYVRADTLSPEFYYIHNSIQVYNTTSVPDTATITNITLSMSFAGDAAVGLGADSLVIIGAKPASNTTIVAGDFDSYLDPAIRYAPNASFADIYSAGRHNITFSNTTWVDKAGFSYLYLTDTYFDDGYFTGTWSSNKYNNLGRYFVSNAGRQKIRISKSHTLRLPPRRPTLL